MVNKNKPQITSSISVKGKIFQKTSIFAILVVLIIKIINLSFFITAFKVVNPTGFANISLDLSVYNYFIWLLTLFGLLSWVPVVFVYKKLPPPNTFLSKAAMFVVYVTVWYVFLSAISVWIVMLFFGSTIAPGF